jgi:dihydrofolate reductase
MRKIIVSEFLSLDGVMQAPGAPDEDRSGGFEHGGWQLGYFDDVSGTDIVASIKASGGILLGRRTYETFAAYWPSAPADNPFSAPMNSLPKYVVSTTLTEPLEWNNSTLLRGDAAEAVVELRKQPGDDLMVIGSGELVQTLMRHGLVGRYRIMLHPLLLGGGKRLFRQGFGKVALRLVESKTSSTGVMILTYEPA